MGELGYKVFALVHSCVRKVMAFLHLSPVWEFHKIRGLMDRRITSSYDKDIQKMDPQFLETAMPYTYVNAF